MKKLIVLVGILASLLLTGCGALGPVYVIQPVQPTHCQQEYEYQAAPDPRIVQRNLDQIYGRGDGIHAPSGYVAVGSGRDERGNAVMVAVPRYQPAGVVITTRRY